MSQNDLFSGEGSDVVAPNTPDNNAEKAADKAGKQKADKRKGDKCNKCVKGGNEDRALGVRASGHKDCCGGHKVFGDTNKDGHFPNCPTLVEKAKKLVERLKKADKFVNTMKS